MRDSGAGTSARAARRSAGASMSVAFNVSTTLSPLNGRAPDSISNIVTPSANKSLRASASRPRTCSGAIYPAVPARLENITSANSDDVSDGAVFSLARPKSRIFTPPSARRNTLSGFRSQWTIPRACAAESPRAICSATAAAVSIDSGPRFRRTRRLSPSTYSDTMNGTPLCSPTS